MNGKRRGSRFQDTESEGKENMEQMEKLKKIRNILTGATVAACIGIAVSIGVGAGQVSSLQSQVEKTQAEVEQYQSKYKSASKKLKSAVSDTDSVSQKLSSVESEYDAYKQKMAPFEKMTVAQAEQETAAAEAAKQETENQNAANAAVNLLWDDKNGLKDGATREEYNDAVDKVGKVGDTAAKNALNEKLKAIDDSMTAKEQAAAAEEAAGYETGITYDQLARTPDQYEGKKVKFRGKVVQVMEDSSGINAIRLAVNSDYDRVVYGEYLASSVPSRVLENDVITIYGTSTGTYTYTSTWGNSVTIPGVDIDKIDQ